MKKNVLVVILIFLLSGCNSNKKFETVENIKFNEVAATYTINRNTSDYLLVLYGSCDNISENNLKNLNSLDIQATLNGTYDKKQVSYNANIVKWEISDSKLLDNNILLYLSIENCMDLVDKVNMDKIIFKIFNSEIEQKIENTYINAYNGTDGSMSVMEAPIAPRGSIELNKKHTFSYKILDTSGIDRELSAKVLYPNEVQKYIEIVDVAVNHDENTELQIKNNYKNQSTKVDLEKIRVYNIECTYILRKDANFVFQPLLKLQDAVENQSLVPFDAMCFFSKNKR